MSKNESVVLWILLCDFDDEFVDDTTMAEHVPRDGESTIQESVNELVEKTQAKINYS
mgnify:CR=1 FL=1